MESKVYFLNVFVEVESAEPSALGSIYQDLSRAGNLFSTLTQAKKAQGEVLKALKNAVKD